MFEYEFLLRKISVREGKQFCSVLRRKNYMDVSCMFVSIFNATNYSNWGLTSVESSGVHNPTIHPLSPPYCYALTLSYETKTFSHVKNQEKNHLPPSSLFLSVPVLSIHHHDHPTLDPSIVKLQNLVFGPYVNAEFPLQITMEMIEEGQSALTCTICFFGK